MPQAYRAFGPNLLGIRPARSQKLSQAPEQKPFHRLTVQIDDAYDTTHFPLNERLKRSIYV